jgi:hypothetical protein
MSVMRHDKEIDVFYRDLLTIRKSERENRRRDRRRQTVQFARNPLGSVGIGGSTEKKSVSKLF